MGMYQAKLFLDSLIEYRARMVIYIIHHIWHIIITYISKISITSKLKRMVF